jgi:hypothetical protein
MLTSKRLTTERTTRTVQPRSIALWGWRGREHLTCNSESSLTHCEILYYGAGRQLFTLALYLAPVIKVSPQLLIGNSARGQNPATRCAIPYLASDR